MSSPSVRVLLGSTLAKLSPFDPIYSASVLGGLLTEPRLHGNTVRLEALAHGLVTSARGRKRPSNLAFASWFNDLSNELAGRFDDAPNGVFAGVVTTRDGEYRVLEGMSESGRFYLQRTVGALEGAPDVEGIRILRRSVNAALVLSELVCQRGNVARYQEGGQSPLPMLPQDIADGLDQYRRRVTFTKKELSAVGLSIDDLSPFIFADEARCVAIECNPLFSPLSDRPILYRDGHVTVAVPSALTYAIRSCILQAFIRSDLLDEFRSLLSGEYADWIASETPFGFRYDDRVEFGSTGSSRVASASRWVDECHVLQFIFVLDNLLGFEEGGMSTVMGCDARTAKAMVQLADACELDAQSRSSFRRGLTLLVPCGIGRAYSVPRVKQSENWKTEALSPADAETLGSLDDFRTPDAFGILDLRDGLRRLGVVFPTAPDLLELVALSRENHGNLLDAASVRGEISDASPLRVLIDPSMKRDVRVKVDQTLDRRCLRSPDGAWLPVRRSTDSLFEEVRELPLYVPLEQNREQFVLAYATRGRTWWCVIQSRVTYERWFLMSTWLPRIAETIDEQLRSEISFVRISIAFTDSTFTPDSIAVASAEEVLADCEVHVEPASNSIDIAVGPLFDSSLAQPENHAEAALVKTMIAALMRLRGDAPSVDADVEPLVRVLTNAGQRVLHLFASRDCRSHFSDELSEPFVRWTDVDRELVALGLGWKGRARSAGETIATRTESTAFLNTIAEQLEKELCSRLCGFDRRGVVLTALTAHERAAFHLERTQLTSSAALSLRENKAESLAVIEQQISSANATKLTARVLAEVAYTECPEVGGAVPGEIEVARMMAIVATIIEVGGWSDAIHLNAMPAEVRIGPLGDVRVDGQLLDTVYRPFVSASNAVILNSEANRAANSYKPLPVVDSIANRFDPAFRDAFKDEFGYSIDDLFACVEAIEDIGTAASAPILEQQASSLIEQVEQRETGAARIIEALASPRRTSWRDIPEGHHHSEAFMWKFRRSLSLLRRPILRVNAGDASSLLVAVGLMRDAAGYSVRNLAEGSFPQRQLRTRSMKAWAGHAAQDRGHRFNAEVAKRLQECGWRVESEVSAGKILGRRLEADFGDVDVLASREHDGRVLLVECKDLHFHKSLSEVCEQLRDFQGVQSNAGRDLLRKHIDRCVRLQKDPKRVAEYLGLSEIKLEPWVIFRHPVPMLFVTRGFEIEIGFAVLADAATI